MWPVIFEIPLPFELFGADAIPIRGFGLMVVLGLLAGNWIATRLARQAGFDDNVVPNLFLVFIAGAILGARMLYVAVNWKAYSSDWSQILAIHQGGMVYYGAFLGVLIGVMVFLWWTKLEARPILDIVTVSAPLGMFLGRIGCLLVGDDFGHEVPEKNPFGIMFPTPLRDGSLWGLEIAKDNGNLAGAFQGKWLHPTQIYMSVNALLIFFLMLWLWNRRRFDGQVAAAFCMVYAVTRSIIEHFRGDIERGFIGPLSTSQFISVFVFLGGAALWFWARKRD